MAQPPFHYSYKLHHLEANQIISKIFLADCLNSLNFNLFPTAGFVHSIATSLSTWLPPPCPLDCRLRPLDCRVRPLDCRHSLRLPASWLQAAPQAKPFIDSQPLFGDSTQPPEAGGRARPKCLVISIGRVSIVILNFPQVSCNAQFPSDEYALFISISIFQPQVSCNTQFPSDGYPSFTDEISKINPFDIASITKAVQWTVFTVTPNWRVTMNERTVVLNFQKCHQFLKKKRFFEGVL